MAYRAADDRYDSMTYRRTGRSGLDLPAISLGLWHNFGDDVPFERQRAILRRAFDLGVTHFDLANNYGPPYGSAETNFGRHLRRRLRGRTATSSSSPPRPAGTCGPARTARAAAAASTCWPASTSRCAGWAWTTSTSSTRHRPDPTTPLEETMGALHSAVRAGKALYVGISSYSPEDTARAAEILADLGTPLLIHQPSYSMLNRWIETEGLLDTLEDVGAGCIAFSPLAQGMLTDKYLRRDPRGLAGQPGQVAVDRPAHRRGARPRPRAERHRQPARAEPGADGAGLGAARPAGHHRPHRREQRPASSSRTSARCGNLDFADDELAAIDEHAVDTGIDLWAQAREKNL